MKNQAIKFLGWTAKILGTTIFAFVVFMIAAHLFGESENATNSALSTREIIMSIGGIISVIGLGLAIFWEGIGGMLTVLGMLVFFGVRTDLILNPGYFGLALISGLLYLFHWYLKKKST